MKDFLIKTIIGFIGFVVCILLLFGALFCAGSIISLFDIWLSPNVIATVNGEKVFEGNSSCITTMSKGSATKLVTYDRLFCMIPQKVYISDKVEVFPK